MRYIEPDITSFIASPEKKFILLRSNKTDQSIVEIQDIILNKVNRKITAELEGVWGTLGYVPEKSDSPEQFRPVDWKGKLMISNKGNDDFEDNSTVMEEVNYLMDLYPNLTEEKQVTERFINFEEMEIPIPETFTLDELPKLRLEVFLGQNEGAVVFYQFQRENDETAAIEYIQPERTLNENTNQRDRLSYYFHVIPKYLMEEDPNIPGQYELTTKRNPNDFIIKILTFKRTFLTPQNKEYVPSDSDAVIRAVESRLENRTGGLFVKKPKLQIYDINKRDFYTVRGKGAINPSKKTLLLIHGTFASTKGSFGKVYKNDNWLHSLIDRDNGYQQIIAYDHPTFFVGIHQNISEFYTLLTTVAGVETFDEEIDIIATSRGGLLAQYLANEKSQIKIGRVSLIACGNGVGYMSFLDKVADGMGILKDIFKFTGIGVGAFISAIMQHSLQWLIEKPGIKVLMPGDETLKFIMYNEPALPTTRYMPITGNVTPEVFNDNRFFNFFRRQKNKRGKNLDLLIDKILGTENDWVISTKNQYKVPSKYVNIPFYNPAQYRESMIPALHGTLIEKKETQHAIEEFISSPKLAIDPMRIESTYFFDAHCHLFGRSIITGRIVSLIIGQIMEYLKSDDPNTEIDPINTFDDTPTKKANIWRIIKNIFQYFFFNADGHQMLDDLEAEYFDPIDEKPMVSRFIPLMFDLEMTFRKQYDVDDSEENMQKLEGNFNESFQKFTEVIDSFKDKIDNGDLNFIHGNPMESELSSKLLLKSIKFLKKLNFVFDFINETKSAYHIQLEELRQLKVQYGADIFPFIATDPRRKNMPQYLKEKIIEDKTFHGVKLYCPNGYSPTDIHFMSESFVDGKPLYQWCIDNEIPIMAHNSDGGFATMTEELQVRGHIMQSDMNPIFKDNEFVPFEFDLFDGGFNKAVEERAYKLNHPKLWRLVLEKYNDLKICLAHFGGSNKEWRDEIAAMMIKYDNVYTDLSCIRKKETLKEIHEAYFENDSPDAVKVREKIMYGSDYFLNLVKDITFEEYYKNFRDIFSDEELKNMSVDVPKRFLAIG